MRVEHQDKQKVVIIVPPAKAQLLLEGLKEHADALRERGAELARLLAEAGVTVPPRRPIRYEYRPPDER
jgi:hypothetical protein